MEVELKRLFSWSHNIVKFITSPFRPGGLYIPGWFGAKPTTTVRPWQNKSVKLTTENVVSPEEVAKKLPSLSYEILPQATPRATVVPNQMSDHLSTLSDILKWGTNNFLKYYSTKQSAEYASKMAEADIESQKAAKAIAESQARIAQLQAQQQSYNRGVSNLLSKEALAKYSSFLLPAAVGLTVVMLLIAAEKERKNAVKGS